MKKIILVIIALLIILIPSKTYALEDSFKEAEYIPGTYIKKINGGTGRYEQMRVFRRNNDNRVVYCLELWKPLSSNKVLSGYTSGQDSYANLPEWKWQKIVLLSYYGYGYQDHTDIKWYAITQFMIWQVIEDNSTIYFTDTLNGNRIDKYTEEMNELDTLTREHYLEPSFNNMTVEYNREYSMNDRNQVLNKYKIANVYGLTSSIDGNTLNFKVTKNGQTLLRFYKEDEIYSNEPTVYIDNSGQNLLLPGSFNVVVKNIFLTVNKTNLTINKIDSDTLSNTPSGEASLDGVEFSLYDRYHNFVSSSKVDNNGKLIFNDIYCGKYYLKETKAGNGYILNDNEIELNVSTVNNSFDIPNEVIKSKVTVNKYLKYSDGSTELENARFTVLDKNNNEYLSFNTENGTYEFYLPYGTYTLKQISGTKNYKYIEDKEIKVEDTNDIELNLYNEELVVPIEITNIDSESNLPILDSGTIFSIVDQNNKEIKLTTNNEGKTITINLTPGVYKIKEIEVVDGYYLNEEEIELIIDEDNFSYDRKVYNIDIPNTKEKAKLEVSKLIEYYLDDKLINTEKDDNIEIDIYAKDDIYTKDGILNYHKDEKINEKELPYGSYYVNNPTDNKIIAINLDTPNTRRIELLDEIYDYTNTINDVPDTYIEDKVSYLYLILIFSGLILYRGKYGYK